MQTTCGTWQLPVPWEGSGSPEAGAIMASPYAAHPQLRAFASKLAEHPKVTAAEAEEMLIQAANDAGLNQLDIEMAQSCNHALVPFLPSASGAASHEDTVNLHVKKLLGMS